MTAIEATSAGVKDMADGSLRITFEFEPRHAREAFALFGSRGQPVAIAALKEGFAQAGKADEPATQEPVKLGPLCMEAVSMAKNESFREWIGADNEHAAADWIRETCMVKSRRELDLSDEATAAFREMRSHFLRWQRERKQS